MAAPTPFVQSFDFGDFSTTNPNDQQPGAQIDAVFGLIKTTTDELIANLNVIQRSDTKLANASVHIDAFSTAALNLLGSNAWTPKGVWATATAYVVGDVVENGTTTYVCVVAHTSGTFATDRGAGNWTPITAATSTDGLLVTDFGATGDGVTDDAAAISAAFAAASDGQLVTFPPGTYLMLSAVNTSNKSLNIQGYGATIKQGADNRCLRFEATFSNIVSIDTVAEDDTQVLNDDGGGTTTAVLKLTRAAGWTDYSVGDICKIVSDDAIPGGNNAADRIGEYVRVSQITGNDLWTTAQTVDTYVGSTAPRLAKMNTDMKVTIRGLVFDTDAAGEAGGWGSNLLMLAGLYNPIISDCGVNRAHAPAFQINGCLGPKIDNCYFRDVLNDDDTSRVGYGILSTSSEYGTYTNCTFIDCRHGYTTGVNNTTTGDADIKDFGRAKHEVISNCTAFNCSSAGFDTHWDAYNVTFSNCTSYGSYIGEASGGQGFNIRGQQNTVNGCSAINCEVGFIVRGESGAFGTIGSTLRNCKAIGRGRGIALTSGASGTDTTKETRIENCIVDFDGTDGSNGADAVLVRDGEDVVIDGLKVFARFTGGTNRRVVSFEEASNAIAKNITIDVSDSDGAVPIRAVVTLLDASTDVVIRDLEVIAGATADLDQMFDMGGTTTSLLVQGLRLDVEQDAGPFFDAGSATKFIIEDFLIAGARAESGEWVRVGELFTVEKTVTFTALNAGSSSILDLDTVDQKRFKCRELILTGEGTNFSGGGGDRDIAIRGSDGTVFSIIPAATAQSLAAGRWGSTGVPFPATVAHLNAAPVAQTDFQAVYSGGTADYAAGELNILMTFQRTV